MLRSVIRTSSAIVIAASTIALLSSCPLAHGGYITHNLVSNQVGLAPLVDPNLVNPMGITRSPTSAAFWVAANGSGKAALYLGDVNGSAFTRSSLSVSVLGGSPTGIAFNGNNGLPITNGTTTANSTFVFGSNSGTLSGWNGSVTPNTTTKFIASSESTNYNGVATVSAGNNRLIYAADFQNHKVDIFGPGFVNPIIDPLVPTGYSPYNVQLIGNRVLVTYAKADESGLVITGDGLGIVSAFSVNGEFLGELVHEGSGLNAPWGMALAPADFGEFSNALLVANHGDGKIHAFDNTTGASLGVLTVEGGDLSIDGLWGLSLGNGVTAGNANSLYFTAGSNGGTNGLLGTIAVPEPTAISLMLLPATLLLTRRR